MRVPEAITKCVAFLAVKGEDEATYAYGGTCFFVSVDSPADPANRGYLFLVTARHNVRIALATGKRLYARLNMKDGTSQLHDLTDTRWYGPPDEASDVLGGFGEIGPRMRVEPVVGHLRESPDGVDAAPRLSKAG
jgi:hypothetical protein